MKRKKNALLIIDAQKDFCNPDGALFVDGAVQDCERLASWILKNEDHIDFISATLDSHSINDIAHPSWWMDKDQNRPAPFTLISSEDVNQGKWIPRFFPKESLEYLKALELNNQFPHCIWPEHCIIGTVGHSLESNVHRAIQSWERKGNWLKVVTKGTNPLTEHFGAFKAQVPIDGSIETQLNINLLKTFESYENVYLAGQAKSHCVANSLKQILEEAPQLAQKLVILEDAMSNVTGFENLADGIYDQAKKQGVKFSTTAIETLK